MEFEPQRQKGEKLKRKKEEAIVAYNKGVLFVNRLQDVRG